MLPYNIFHVSNYDFRLLDAFGTDFKQDLFPLHRDLLICKFRYFVNIGVL